MREQQTLLVRLGARQAAQVQPVLVGQFDGARRVGAAAPGVQLQKRLLPLGDHVAQLKRAGKPQDEAVDGG